MQLRTTSKKLAAAPTGTAATEDTFLRERDINLPCNTTPRKRGHKALAQLIGYGLQPGKVKQGPDKSQYPLDCVFHRAKVYTRPQIPNCVFHRATVYTRPQILNCPSAA